MDLVEKYLGEEKTIVVGTKIKLSKPQKSSDGRTMVPKGEYEVKMTNSKTTELYMLWKGQRQSVYKIPTKTLYGHELYKLLLKGDTK
jgi:hypothetical protein